MGNFPLLKINRRPRPAVAPCTFAGALPVLRYQHRERDWIRVPAERRSIFLIKSCIYGVLPAGVRPLIWCPFVRVFMCFTGACQPPGVLSGKVAITKTGSYLKSCTYPNPRTNGHPMNSLLPAGKTHAHQQPVCSNSLLLYRREWVTLSQGTSRATPWWTLGERDFSCCRLWGSIVYALT